MMDRSLARVRVPASVANLGPGFDALGLALDLFNEVEVECLGEVDAPRPAAAEVEVHGEGEEELPRDASNRVVQAAARLWRRERGRTPHLRVRCVNRVPLRSGMGSSAAAAVAGLVAAWHLLGEPLGPEDLLALAWELEGHGDNAAPALAGGLTALLPKTPGFLRLEPPALEVALALPDRRWGTEASRSVLPQQVSRGDAAFNVAASAALVAALASGRYEMLAACMEDRLHQPYRLPHIPGAGEAVEAARVSGALGVALAGAGPAVLAFADPGRGRAVAEAMAQAFRRVGEPARPIVCRPAAEGALGRRDEGLERHRGPEVRR